MTETIWNGTGDAGNAITFQKRNGEVVGRHYVRRRAMQVLSHIAFPSDTRRTEKLEILRATVENDEWLAPRNGMLVEAICRDVRVFAITGE